MPDQLDGLALVIDTIGGDVKLECPFSHEDKKKNLSNELKGVGTTLGTNMESGDQTILNDDEGGGKPLPAKQWMPRPSKDPDKSAVYQEQKPITLINLKSKARKSYALTCAAHHLIPAQASLRDCDLMQWIKEGSEIREDIGYNVNGLQNGVWLPGNYAMRGKWGKMKDSEDDVADLSDGPTSGKIEDAQYWYAICAMVKVGAQFHDAHPDYSDFVTKCLNKVAVLMSEQDHFCEKCKKKSKKPKPAPFKLVHRLNLISDRLRGRLVGQPSSWNKNIWTSRFALAYLNLVSDQRRKPGPFRCHSLG